MRLFKAVILVLLISAASTGAVIAWGSESLKLKRVEVVGNENVTALHLVETSGLRKGTHLLELSTSKVASRIEKVPWVADARVERIIPSRVRITVIERKPEVVVDTFGVRFLADRDGFILEEKDAELVRISEVLPEPPAVGSRITMPQFAHVFTILDSLPEPLLGRVEEVRARSVDRITLVLDDGITVLYGAAEQLEDKNFAVAALMQKYESEGKRLGSIDVRVPSRPAVRVS